MILEKNHHGLRVPMKRTKSSLLLKQIEVGIALIETLAGTFSNCYCGIFHGIHGGDDFIGPFNGN